MTAFRFFSWDMLPEPLLATLADAVGPGAGDEAEPADRLDAVVGPQPDDDFVREHWRLLLDSWLSYDTGARARIVEALRARDLGDGGIETTTTAGELAFLRSCRNAPTLRAVVLDEMLTYGEPPYLAPLRSGVSSALDHLPPRPDGDTTAAALSEWVERTLTVVFGERVHPEGDGEISIARGSSATVIRVDPDRPVLHIFSRLVSGMTPDPEIHAALNTINVQVPVAKAVVVDGGRTVILNADLLADTVSPAELLVAIDLVSAAADHFDTLLAERFGGRLRGIDAEPPLDLGSDLDLGDSGPDLGPDDDPAD